ncbi:MAG: 5'-nucleotidase [Pedobacter sp.]|nr:5'-nucleotidase [Pedobacter sp.]MDQ8051856.1 5'-nucleotidase [Pedobacter sp.]
MSIQKNLYFLSISILWIGGCTATGQIVKSNREEYHINSSLPVDSNIIKTYLPYKTALDAEMSKVIGYTEVDLTKNSDVPETVLGNFFADAVAHQAKKIVPNIDVVFPTTKGGIRNDIAKGSVTVSNIFELMPFENQLVLLELNGSDMYTVISYIAATNGQPVNGLKMKVVNKSPENVRINGQPFDKNRTYRILTSDYIANGGDEAKGFSKPISRKNIGLLVRDALMKEVMEIQANGNKINSKLDGRITVN